MAHVKDTARIYNAELRTLDSAKKQKKELRQKREKQDKNQKVEGSTCKLQGRFEVF